MDLDINEIFSQVVSHKKPQPNSYPLAFELDSIKELFEFLLQFVTMLCKYFYVNESAQVDLNTLTPEDFIIIDSYMQSIGFRCIFRNLPANANNLNWANITRYDRVEITPQTKLRDLHFGLKCNTALFVISFESLNNSC